VRSPKPKLGHRRSLHPVPRAALTSTAP
jgi:hypothetical protein